MNLLTTTAPRTERRGRSDRIARSSRGESRGFQIGPRIRIGGTLGKAGQKLKEGIGKVEKAIAPAAMLIPGVGQIAAPILNTAGHLFDTSDGGVHLNTLPKLALQDAGLYGGGKLAGAVESKLAGTDVGKSVLSKIGIGSKVPMAASDGVTQAGSSGGGSSLFDIGKKVVSGASHLLGGGANGSLLDKALLIGSVADQALTRKRANDLQNKGLDYATNSYSERQPLRTLGLQLLQDQPAGAVANPPAVGARTPVTPGASY